jgi:hypothetical protein
MQYRKKTFIKRFFADYGKIKNKRYKEKYSVKYV